MVIGLLLGGVAGFGTVLYALAIGPLTQLMLPSWIVELESQPPPTAGLDTSASSSDEGRGVGGDHHLDGR